MDIDNNILATVQQMFDDQAQQIADIAVSITEKQAQIERLSAEIDSEKKALADMIPTGRTVNTGQFTVTNRPGARRLDEKKIREAFPPTASRENALLYKLTVNPTAFKEKYGARLDEFSKATKGSVIVKPARREQ